MVAGKKEAVTAAAACFAVGYLATKTTTTSEQFMSSDLNLDAAEAEDYTMTTTGDDISIIATNSYGASVTGFPWTIVEPYIETTLTLSNADVDTDWEWTVNGEIIEGMSDSSMIYTFTDLGENSVGATSRSDPSDFIATNVAVKYVRREIRSLTDYDREAFLNAVTVVQRVPTTAGQALYGENFFNKDDFNRIHLYYGGTADCDHWHQGAGFVTSHVGFTLMFEKALQAVNPTVSVPYWDFTIESMFYDSDTWRDTPLFSDDWFGDADPDNDFHTVTEGRFAYVPTMQNAWNFSSVTNSYGLLRSPWNNDPTPYMTRNAEVYGLPNNLKPSGCAEYHGVLSSSDWMGLSKGLNSAAHGHLHELMGGSWNNNLLDFIEGDVGPAHIDFAHQIQQLSKILWREEFVICPEYCSSDTPWDECECQCTAESISDDSGAQRASYDILSESGVLEVVSFFDQGGKKLDEFYDDDGNVYYTLPDHGTEESQNIYNGLLKMLCSPGHIGDMFQATSPNDITFWVLHPSLDRLWDYKRMAPPEAMYEETWDPFHTCYGHNPNDIQPFKMLFGETEPTGHYTNAQLYENLDPNNINKPYVYDNFEWPHCELAGYDMGYVNTDMPDDLPAAV